MDIVAIKASFESMVLWGCAGVAVLIGMAGLGVVAYKSPGKILEVARKRGWLYVIVMGVFVAVATDAGSPTQEDKERDRMMRRQQAAEDAAWGAALGIGGLDAMDAEHRRLDATLAGKRPSGGRSEGVPEGALSASPETVDAAEGAMLPSVRPLTDSDYAAGIALARIGMNEVWDFSAPAGAEICTDWLEFGAEKDWFKTQFTNSWSFAFGTNTVDAMTVYSYGLSRPVATNAATFFAPMRTRLGVARAANWEQLAESDRPSQFWQFLTPSNTLVMTWQNVLLDRASDRPVSFQMEFWENGDVMFRYDLSRLAEDVVTNLVVGISNAGEGRVFTALAKNTTSLRWVHLDPTRPFDADPDNDGVTTEDEILIHGTDPYAADTDLDGLSDGREIGETNTDPLDPHSVDPRYPDGMAVVIGDLDPFSCPPGSTNTVWEHVFYTGTTNRPFAYPVSSDGNAVLRVTVSGSGSGELIVGDQVVPLLGMPSEPSSRMMARSRSGERPGNAHDLLVSVGHGVVRRAVIRGSADLALDYQSDDYCIGVRPTWLVPVGWFAFPNTKASEPCIHDLNAKRVAVSLDPGPEIEGLTCTWIPEANLEVDGRPPLSALLTGSFSRDATQQATYRLDHPHELFGQKVYSQTARFCPRKEPGSADDPSPAPGEGGYSSTEDSDPTESYQPECWCWSDCEWCDCPCHWNPDVPNTSVDPDNCPLHSMPYEQCEPMHCNSYHTATNSMEQVEEVLKLHRPLHEQDHSCLSIKVPTEWVQCCDCPDHWTNYVSVAYKSHRIAAHLNGQPFDRTVHDGILDVYGVLPSSSFGDATLSLCKTGHVYETHNYTVLGVGIHHREIDLDRLNRLNRDFGLPTTVQTNLEHALRLNLRTDVCLPSGDVHLALEDATIRMQLWMMERDGNYHLLLDTDGKSTLDMPLVRWKKLVAYATSDRETEVRLLTFGEGRAKLFFGYAGANGDAYVHDEAAQMISVIPTPLLPDYNRDGTVDEIDQSKFAKGDCTWFWTNRDTWKGDDAFDEEFWVRPNVSDGIVNGRCDAVNFLPISMDLSALASEWSPLRFKYEIVADDSRLQKAQICIVSASRASLGVVPEGDCPTLTGTPMRDASVGVLGSSTNLPSTVVFADAEYALAVEFPEAFRDASLSLRVSLADGTLCFAQPLRITASPIDEMYGWVNLRRLVGKNEGDATSLSAPGWPSSEHQPGNLVFAHGYNVTKDEARTWSRSVFKKLWFSGLDRGFIAVTWYGNEGQLGWGSNVVTFNYYGNVQNAFESAHHYKQQMDQVPGPKWFFAHSLGNMLTSAAIQDYGMPYERYFLLNAAIAKEAFEPVDGITVESHDNMTPRAWTNYTDRVRATHWFERFPEGDGRRLLTWKGRFNTVTNIVNFYSSEEEVVNNGDGETHSLADRLYVWYNQETRKGSWPLMWHEYEGGWAFNPYYDVTTNYWIGSQSYSKTYHMPSADADNLTDPQLQARPFFLDFANPQMHSSSNGFIVATDYSYRAEMLAYAIPAESYAVGANSIGWLLTADECLDSPELQGNFDMAVEFGNGREDLPLGTTPESNKQRWVHSTFAQRSYKRTRQLFKKIVDKMEGGR